MKIAMIMDAWDPIIWGGQVHVQNICEKLIINHNCSIDLFVRSLEWDDWKIYDKDEILLDGKLKIFRCWRPKQFFHFIERILSIFSIAFKIIHQNKKYDLIHAHAFLWLLSWKIASSCLQIPIIATIHWANLLDKWEKNVFYFIEKFLLTQIKYDQMISVWSRFLEYKNINKNIIVIWNGVNLSSFDQTKKQGESNVYKILFVGRLEWTKWIDILIEAVKLLDREILEKNGVEFHLIWYWYQESDYKNLVRIYNLDKYIFFRWKITGDKLVREYRSSNVFVLPSRTEWFPITILEALASCLPVIATRCWWIEDIIFNWKNWFLIKKENVNELAKILTSFINGNILNLDKIIENGYKYTSEHYTWDLIAKKTMSCYIKLLKAYKVNKK